jgi:hypothetical protein
MNENGTVDICRHCGKLISGDNVKEDYSFKQSGGKTLMRKINKCKNCVEDDKCSMKTA